MIKGIEYLTDKQLEIMAKTNERHRNAVGLKYKDGMEIKKVWIENGVVCVKLKNKEWYHYSSSYDWY